ncbi:MAG TPA: tetratricopeptide repeat protein [Polyangiaceae bacterium]|nr:tetratricopeptide repeat protein [Polyangiaceae bacterium]
MDFRSYVAQPDEELDLLTGALLIAKDVYPGLDLGAQKRRLGLLAAPLAGRGLDSAPLLMQAAALGEYLYDTCGFRGNREDYYDPRNSFVNEVIERRLGIPITLAVVYVEVARRIGVRAHGVGFPGHFLVRVEDSDRGEAVIIDPFGAGAVLDKDDLEQLLRKGSGARLELSLAMLAPTPVRHILARILMNLRGIYATRADYPRLLVVLDRMIDLIPDVANEVRDRGLLWAKLGAPQAAIDDLNRYLESLPHAGDVAEVRRLIDQLERKTRQAEN